MERNFDTNADCYTYLTTSNYPTILDLPGAVTSASREPTKGATHSNCVNAAASYRHWRYLSRNRGTEPWDPLLSGRIVHSSPSLGPITPVPKASGNCTFATQTSRNAIGLTEKDLACEVGDLWLQL